MTYRLVLVRHGESQWNVENRFTGWTDVPLSPRGEAEATAAGGLLAAEGVSFSTVHTSLLRRAIQTAQRLLAAADPEWIDVKRSWRLNERHYGALQGLNKKETAARHSDEQVFVWRRSYDTPPPPLDAADERHPSHDPRYAQLAPELLPATECLKDVVHRVLPYWHDVLVPELRAGGTPLVVAHGNSLRAIVKHLEGVSDADIAEWNIPTGTPRLIVLDRDLRLLEARYLGDAAAIAAAQAAVAAQGKR
jgi:2,3-bisphosphoglycerate-dependent phosphoglycerate mutase